MRPVRRGAIDEPINPDSKHPKSSTQSGIKLAYAMQIPKEFHDESLFGKKIANDAVDEAIMRNVLPGSGYQPTPG